MYNKKIILYLFKFIASVWLKYINLNTQCFIFHFPRGTKKPTKNFTGLNGLLC